MSTPHHQPQKFSCSKVPHVTAAFWIIKILATTLGETGGDAVTMSLKLGYAVGSLIFLAIFAVALAVQTARREFHPFAYWAVVVATTTVGTTLSDYCDRTLGMGYVWSSILFFTGVIALLLAWRFTMGKVQYEYIIDRKDEIFYWVTILVSNTLGTALGDFASSDTGLGFERGTLLFASLLLVLAAAYRFTNIPRSGLFWASYILTRPLGATLGDTLTKPHEEGGLELSRIMSSLIIAALMIVGIVFFSKAPGRCPPERATAS